MEPGRSLALDLNRKTQFETFLRMLPLVFALTLACGIEIPTDDPAAESAFLDEVIDDLEKTETASTENSATETAIVAGTATAESLPTNTPTPEENRISSVYTDALDDCQFSDGKPTECFGIDIDRIVIGRIQNEDELFAFTEEAGEEGFFLPDTPITVPYPFIIAGVIIQDFNPDASFICFNWADQQTATAPSEPIANALATCYNPRHEFLYVNNIDASGQQGVEADPEGTLVFIDPDIGITFVQELGRIYSQEPLSAINLLVVENDESRFDGWRIELEEQLWAD